MLNSTLLWIVRDTFRQARASRVSWLMLGFSGLCIAFCLSLRIAGGDTMKPPDAIELYGVDDQPLSEGVARAGSVSFAFGGIRLGLFRDAEAEVRFLRAVLGRWVAGAAGTLLALVWTAGFLPESLRPGTASVLLAKPVRRGSLLLGKYLGVLLVVAAQAAVFVVGTWMALGMRTGLWSPDYLLCLPILVLHFALAFAATTLLAVWARNTMTCALGSLLFWVICCAMNYGRHASVAAASASNNVATQTTGFRWAREAAYWVLPKPADLLILLDRVLQAGDHLATVPEFDTVQRLGAFHPTMAVLSSILFASALLAVAIREFEATDY